MNTDLRRSQRHNDFLPVSVTACKRSDGKTEVGPFAGRIVNISKHGVCVLMSLGVLDSYNIYRATYQNDSLHLEINGKLPQVVEEFSLSATPIWMDPFVIDDIRAFKMGVDFLSSTDTLRSEEIIEVISTEPSDDMLLFTEE